jgi:signal transduction histidine kinase
MDPDTIKKRSWLLWVGVALLSCLCATLAVLQYRWIGEVAQAERRRLQDDLQSRLDLLRRNLNEQISAACSGYLPVASDFEKLSRDEAYLHPYRDRKAAGDQIVRRIALAIPGDKDVALWFPNDSGTRFIRAQWPPEWAGMHEHLLARLRGLPPVPNELRTATLLEFPRFGMEAGRSDNRNNLREQEWLVLELDQDVLARTVIPAMLDQYVGDTRKLDYRIDGASGGVPTAFIYASGDDPKGGWTPDASIRLMDITPTALGAGSPAAIGQERRSGAQQTADSGGPYRGLWLLRVRDRAGTADALAGQARRRNVFLSAGILLLILLTAAALLTFSRQAQRMAELQMNFVANVSHELRTPLSVIRTAAYNLRGDLARRSDHVVRYGNLIEKESEKLSSLVEQVLRYGNARAGRALQECKPVGVDRLIENGVSAVEAQAAERHVRIERHIEAGLPLVLADEEAMSHALQNLLDNALKYATEDNRWIGVFASRSSNGQPHYVEVRVADRGPGIPVREQASIFDSFFRGRLPLKDQIHGTGLGLSLVKGIVEAHGGTVRVKSRDRQGAEFIVRIPAILPETQHERAHTLG